MKKIFITGGAGFIGSFLTEELIKQGFEVAIFDDYLNFINDERYYKRCLEARRTFLTQNPSKKYKGDIRKREELKNAVEDFDPEIIIHLAALPMARPPENHEKEMLPINIQGTFNVFDIFENSKAKRIIFASSSMAYGHFMQNPQPEDSILKPTNTYGATKAASEYFLKLSKKEWIIVRATSVYGFTDCANRVTQLLIDAAFRNKSAWVVKGEALDFTYIDDVVDGYVRCVTSEAVHNIFNISKGKARLAADFAEILKKFFPQFSYEIREPLGHQIWRGSLDIKKAKNLLQFDPKYRIEEGIKKILELVEKYNFYNF